MKDEPSHPRRIFARLPRYASSPSEARRLDARWRMLVEPVAHCLDGKTVLDLASHDGRWAYAYAAAGAARVVGVEARSDLVAEFATFPDDDAKARVTLFREDVYCFLEAEVARGQTYDVVAILGILYHVMDHHRLLLLVRALEPKLIIIDSEFIVSDNPMVQLVKECTQKRSNTTAHYEGQREAIIGIPSTAALERIAETLGYTTAWADWTIVPREARSHLHDYYRPGRKRRGTCYLERIC